MLQVILMGIVDKEAVRKGAWVLFPSSGGWVIIIII